MNVEAERILTVAKGRLILNQVTKEYGIYV
jgi:hypothetical protein